MHNHWKPVPCPPPHRPECGDPIIGKIIDGRMYPNGCVTEEDYLEDKAVLNNTISGIATNVSELSSILADKVDKVAGKGLSTEDYTTEEKNKLSGIEAQANKTVVDSELSSSSLNPVQNKVVKAALDNKVNNVSGKGLSTEDFTTELLTKLTNIEAQANRTIVDSEMSSSSTNPVQNKVIKAALDQLPKVVISETQPAEANCLWIKTEND